jgi:hypothetical protein
MVICTVSNGESWFAYSAGDETVSSWFWFLKQLCRKPRNPYWSVHNFVQHYIGGINGGSPLTDVTNASCTLWLYTMALSHINWTPSLQTRSVLPQKMRLRLFQTSSHFRCHDFGSHRWPAIFLGRQRLLWYCLTPVVKLFARALSGFAGRTRLANAWQGKNTCLYSSSLNYHSTDRVTWQCLWFPWDKLIPLLGGVVDGCGNMRKKKAPSIL